MKEYSSVLQSIKCGVLQGSILGPTLFLLYINDICNVSSILKCILFADDTNFLCSGDDLFELCEIICLELEKLSIWFAVNKLSLNVEKTNFMIFAKYNNNYDNLHLCIKDELIKRVHHTKFLGVYIDEKLNWKYHINCIATKLAKSVSISYKASFYLEKPCLRMLYYTLFFPYINYCSETWGNTYKTNLNKLVVLQKKALRNICKAKRLEHTNSLFIELNILKLYDLIEFKTVVIVFKARHKILPIKVQNNFTFNTDQFYNTRSRQKVDFVPLRPRTMLKSMCVSLRGVRLWNNLSCEFRNCSSIQMFKNKYKKGIFIKYKQCE